jgi:hypothetical protein
MLLVAATLVTHGDVAVVVTTRTTLLGLEQRRDRLAFVQAGVTTLTTARRPAEVGLTLISAMVFSLTVRT